MKKLLLISASTVFILANSTAQNAIPNPGFDSWVNMGSYENPSGGWGTIADISGGFVVTCYKATAAADIHSGTYAIRLITKNIPLQGEAPGIAVTGTINQSTQGVDGGVVYTLRPDSIVGWYKYTPFGADTGSLDVRLSKWNTTTNTRDEVAHARFEKTTSVSTYTRFSEEFVYSLPINPDTMVIVLMSSWGGATSANTNSVIFFDDLDLIFNPATGINEQNTQSPISVYPNPAAEAITFTSDFPKFSLQVLDAAGKQILKKESNTSDYRIDVSNLSNGIYFYELIPMEADKIKRGKFAVAK